MNFRKFVAASCNLLLKLFLCDTKSFESIFYGSESLVYTFPILEFSELPSLYHTIYYLSRYFVLSTERTDTFPLYPLNIHCLSHVGKKSGILVHTRDWLMVMV